MGWISFLSAIRYRIAIVVFALGMTVGTYLSDFGWAALLFGFATLVGVWLLVNRARYIWELHMGSTASVSG